MIVSDPLSLTVICPAVPCKATSPSSMLRLLIPNPVPPQLAPEVQIVWLVTPVFGSVNVRPSAVKTIESAPASMLTSLPAAVCETVFALIWPVCETLKLPNCTFALASRFCGVLSVITPLFVLTDIWFSEP